VDFRKFKHCQDEHLLVSRDVKSVFYRWKMPRNISSGNEFQFFPHHVFLIIITCISFDSVQICRYFIYFDVTHAANEDWPRVCDAFLLLFCINFDHQLVKGLYLSTVTLTFCSLAATKNRWWTWSFHHLITSFVKWLQKVTWFVNVRKFNKWFVIQTPPSRPFYFKTAHSAS